jgi:endonuclease III
MPISASERIRRALTLLEKQYGRLLLTKAGDPLDQLIYQVLLAGVSRKEADGALRRLRANFVDWNEVRVSGPLEIAAYLSELPAAVRQSKAEAVKGILQRLFLDKNKISLSWIEGMDTEKAFNYLIRLPGVTPGIAALGVSLAETQRSFAPLSGVVRIATRMGVIKKTSSAEAGADQLAQVVEKREVLRLITLFVPHGETVCGVKSFICSSCAINTLCAMGKERVKTLADRRATVKADA